MLSINNFNPFSFLTKIILFTFVKRRKRRKTQWRRRLIYKVWISLIIGSSEGGFRSRDERKRAENM
jgi:polyferredoxin